MGDQMGVFSRGDRSTSDHDFLELGKHKRIPALSKSDKNHLKLSHASLAISIPGLSFILLGSMERLTKEII